MESRHQAQSHLFCCFGVSPEVRGAKWVCECFCSNKIHVWFCEKMFNLCHLLHDLSVFGSNSRWVHETHIQCIDEGDLIIILMIQIWLNTTLSSESQSSDATSELTAAQIAAVSSGFEIWNGIWFAYKINENLYEFEQLSSLFAVKKLHLSTCSLTHDIRHRLKCYAPPLSTNLVIHNQQHCQS